MSILFCVLVGLHFSFKTKWPSFENQISRKNKLMKEAGILWYWLFQNVMRSDLRGNIFIFSSPIVKTVSKAGRTVEL